MSDFIKLISCPVTKKIFNTPVLASDGVVYEAGEALKLFIEENKDMKIIVSLKALIDMFLLNNPRFKDMQYKPDPNFDINKVYVFNKCDILNIFTDRVGYRNLLKYDGFKISDIDRFSFKDFLRIADPDVVVYYFDHCDNLNYIWSGLGSVINYVCLLSPDEVVMHLINKDGVDLEYVYNNGYRPVHHIANTHGGELTRQMISKGVDLFSKTCYGDTALDIIFLAQDYETVVYALNNIKNNKLDDGEISKLLAKLESNPKISSDDRENIKFILVDDIV